MSFQKVMNEHHRLSILHALAAMDNYSANSSIIKTVCASYGNSMTSDTVLSHLAWLKEQDLISTEQMGSYTIATLTHRGLDVEQGMASQPGVKRPGPRA
jgi:DNA-binding transcriptional ArsR family regulator